MKNTKFDSELLNRKIGLENIQVLKAEENADRLTVTTSISMVYVYAVVVILAEDIDLLVILTGIIELNRHDIFFQKCGKGRTWDVTYSNIFSTFKIHISSSFLFKWLGVDKNRLDWRWVHTRLKVSHPR